MALAQVGPLTGVLEALATAVGAGVVVGGVAGGIRGLVRGLLRSDIEDDALFGGYIGGGIGAVLVLFDLICATLFRGELSAMKETMKQSIRHANIGIGVCALIAAVGVFIFRNQGEEALQLVGLAAILGAFTVYFTLEERARRKQRRTPQ